MKPDQAPTREELEAVRKQLIEQIDEAEQLFDTSHNGHELLTGKTALKIIEQLLRRTRKQQKGDAA
jgi:hypothetical protein